MSYTESLNKIDLSIIILNYNTYKITCNCIESILNTTHNTKYEIVLVDNGSTECDSNLFKEKFPKINLITSKVNLGFSKGNNLGIANSKGKYILLLNSDTIVEENTIDFSLDRIRNNEKIGVLTCMLKYPNGQIQHQCRRFETIVLALVEKLRLHKFFPSKLRSSILHNGYFDHKQNIYTDRIWGTFFLFLKDDLVSFPEQKLAETFFMYGEDNEWCYQFKHYTKKKIFYFSEVSIIHLMGASNFKNNNNQKINVINTNRIVYLNKYYGVFKTQLLEFIKNI